MKKKRKICVVTSSRADYNHLFILIENLKKSTSVNLQIIATGMHLLKKYGETYKEILNDGFKINEKIKIKEKDISVKNIIKLMSTQLKNTYKVFKKLNPDIIIILGDRYDIFPIVVGAHIMSIPVAHFHGGEITHGVIDDAIRHSITKMSDIHFVANKEFKNRVLQLGESRKHIFNIGSLGVDSIKTIKFFNKSYISVLTGIKNISNYFVISVHPETINEKNSIMINSLLSSLDSLRDFSFIFTYPNSDNGSLNILNPIKKFIKKNKNNSILIESAGRINYINLLKHSNGVIGNSSSGFVEAPALGIPTINIGGRQDGRPTTKSIINASYSIDSIKLAIRKSQRLLNKPIKQNLPYKGRSQIKKILDTLIKINLKNIKLKKFNTLINEK